MDMLEQESSDLADRLIQVSFVQKVRYSLASWNIQDQVTRAEEEENCFIMQEELSAARLAEQKAVKRMKEADHRMRTMEHDFEEHKSEALKSKKEHKHLLEAKNKDIKNLQEKILKVISSVVTQSNCSLFQMKNDNLDGQPVEKTEEDKPLDDRQVTVTTSEDEVEEWKKLSEETKKDLQELRIKIRDLKNIWRSHLQVVLCSHHTH